LKKPGEPVLAVIVPCYNEEEALPETAKSLSGKISRLISAQVVSPKSTLLFVDDGSNDNTWSLIEKLHSDNPLVFNGIKLSGNTGQQNALLSGLLYIKDYTDITITIDADLQDDTDAIDRMLEGYFSGSEIVLGVRSGRETDGFFKRTSSRFFYRLMCFLGSGVVNNHADFRLMGSKALEALAEYNGAKVFLRGIVPGLGYETGIVYYKRKKRLAGKSKYTLQKMLNLAFTGITSTGIMGQFTGKKSVQAKQRQEYHIEKSLFMPEQT